MNTVLQAAGIGAGAAFALSIALSGLVAWSGPVDPPGARSAHGRPTPTSGGVAVMIATGFALWIAGRLLPQSLDVSAAWECQRVAATVILAGGLGLVGALDDIWDFGARPKLVVQMAMALIFAFGVAHVDEVPIGLGLSLRVGDALGSLGVALWIVVATNAVNFMDGANGLAPSSQAIVFSALAALAIILGRPILAIPALIPLGASLGFLPWNLTGRLFQGDAGALFCSFLFAGLSILLATAQTGFGVIKTSLYVGPLALLPFLTDVLLTLAVRAKRGQSLFQAHQDHLYQLWLRRSAGRSHLSLTWRVALLMAVYAGFALYIQSAPTGMQPLIFACAVVVSATGWIVLRRRLETVFKPPG